MNKSFPYELLITFRRLQTYYACYGGKPSAFQGTKNHFLAFSQLYLQFFQSLSQIALIRYLKGIKSEKWQSVSHPQEVGMEAAKNLQFINHPKVVATTIC